MNIVELEAEMAVTLVPKLLDNLPLNRFCDFTVQVNGTQIVQHCLKIAVHTFVA